MSTRARRDHARLLRFQPRLETLERRDLMTWSPQLVPVAQIAPNNLINEAQDVGPIDFAQGVQIAGAVSTPTDVGFYQFELYQPTDVTLNLAGTGIASLYDNDPLAKPLDHPLLLQINAGSSQSINLLAGTYEVAVSGLGDRYFSPVLADSGSDGSTGAYSLTITGDNPTFDTNVAVPVVRTDIPARGYTSSPLAINVTLTQPLDLVNDYVTIVDSQQNDYGPSVTWQPAVNDLVITPTAPLNVGNYQIVAYDASGNQILSIPFSVVGVDGHSAATPINDTLATATPLGDLTHTGLVQMPGAIGTDPSYSPWSANPANGTPSDQVDMYSFTVSGPGRQVLTAEVFAGRIGSALDPALTLFKLTGEHDGTPTWQLIAGNDNSYNPTVAADGKVPLFTDPVLYAGLTAGHYVVAVSGSGNYGDPLLGLQPGTDGIFDPNQAHSGTASESPTGPYVLNLLLQPASPTPPQVVSTSIAPGAILTGPPTQVTVQFSTPVNLVQMAVLSGQEWRQETFSGNVNPARLQRFPVFVTDADGDRYTLVLDSYDTSTGIATFDLFDRLTDGDYALHLSGPAGLTDLAGDPLVGNDPSGDYVVPFSVTDSPAESTNQVLSSATTSAAASDDLGTLFPTELAAGISIVRNFQGAGAAPASSADYYEFTLLQGASLVLSLGGPGLNVAGRPVLLDADGNPAYPAVDPELPGNHEINLLLNAGTYIVEVGGWTAATSGSAVYTLNIDQNSLPEDPTPLTTGPAPAFQLRLDTAAPTTPTPVASTLASIVPQVVLPSPATPSITLTLDRSGASSVMSYAAPLVGIATSLATGPVGVVGSATSTSSDPVRLVLPGSELPATAVSTTDDIPLPTVAPRRDDRSDLGVPQPAVATASVDAGQLASAVNLGLQALVFYSLEWMQTSPLMTQPLFFEPGTETAPRDDNADTDTTAAPAIAPVEPTGGDPKLVSMALAAGVALAVCVGADGRLLASRDRDRAHDRATLYRARKN